MQERDSRAAVAGGGEAVIMMMMMQEMDSQLSGGRDTERYLRGRGKSAGVTWSWQVLVLKTLVSVSQSSLARVFLEIGRAHV